MENMLWGWWGHKVIVIATVNFFLELVLQYNFYKKNSYNQHEYYIIL